MARSKRKYGRPGGTVTAPLVGAFVGFLLGALVAFAVGAFVATFVGKAVGLVGVVVGKRVLGFGAAHLCLHTAEHASSVANVPALPFGLSTVTQLSPLLQVKGLNTGGWHVARWKLSCVITP